MIFVIEDELHAEPKGEFATFDDALAELRRFAAIPWDEHPNRAPCTSSKTCGRNYEVIEYDETTKPYWTERSRTEVLKVSAAGVDWAAGFAPL